MFKPIPCRYPSRNRPSPDRFTGEGFFPPTRRKSFCQGQAFFFSFSGLKDKLLNCHLVQGERVPPERANELLPGSENSGPLFLECRNYFEIPKTCKGMICAYTLMSDPETWKYGIINRATAQDQFMHVYTWKGTLTNGGSRPGTKELYPTFYFLKMADLIEIKDKDIEWNRHFTRTSIDMDQFEDFRYINQVRGLFPQHWIDLHCNHINPFDGAYEQSLSGPNTALLPPKQFNKYLIFPKLTSKNRPFFTNNISNFEALFTIKQKVK